MNLTFRLQVSVSVIIFLVSGLDDATAETKLLRYPDIRSDTLVFSYGGDIYTASTNGLTGYPLYADYNASKAGVIELSRSMALELAPKIRVNAVAPGYVLTPMQRAEYSDDMLKDVNRKIPLERHAEPAEVAALFAFLASDDAEFISGQVYTIDGAETAGGLAGR